MENIIAELEAEMRDGVELTAQERQVVEEYRRDQGEHLEAEMRNGVELTSDEQQIVEKYRRDQRELLEKNLERADGLAQILGERSRTSLN